MGANATRMSLSSPYQSFNRDGSPDSKGPDAEMSRAGDLAMTRPTLAIPLSAGLPRGVRGKQERQRATWSPSGPCVPLREVGR